MNPTSFVNPSKVPENLAGKTVKAIYITSVPSSQEIQFTANTPNEPLYPEGVGRYRWLIGSGSTFVATTWTTVHGNLDFAVPPEVSAGTDVFFNFFPNTGVVHQIEDVAL